MPDDQSPLAPPLPIPNRTVKRRRADDSADCPCESRSSSGTLKTKRPDHVGAFVFERGKTRYRISISPSFDLGDAGVGGEGGGDADADLGGGERGEGNAALDQVVAADG